MAALLAFDHRLGLLRGYLCTRLVEELRSGSSFEFDFECFSLPLLRNIWDSLPEVYLPYIFYMEKILKGVSSSCDVDCREKCIVISDD